MMRILLRMLLPLLHWAGMLRGAPVALQVHLKLPGSWIRGLGVEGLSSHPKPDIYTPEEAL